MGKQSIFNVWCLLLIAASCPTDTDGAKPVASNARAAYEKGSAGRRLLFSPGSRNQCNILADSNPNRPLSERLEDRNTECKRGQITQFVIGGKEAKPNRFPYIVSLRSSRSGQHYCGGSLIAPDKVLTAAHCIWDNWGNGDRRPVVRIGGLNRLSRSGSAEVGTASAQTHPGWNGDIQNGFDLAIITLERPVDISPFQPVKVAGPETRLTPGQRLLVAGWGKNSPSRTLPTMLQVGQIGYVPKDDCDSRYERAVGFKIVTDSMICAFNTSGVDACQGDSGGPLVIPDPMGRPSADILVGDVSLGVGGCVVDETPAIFGSIPNMYDFVRPHLPAQVPAFSGVSAWPRFGCHQEWQVAWRFAVCPFGLELWRSFLEPRFRDILEEETGLTRAAVTISTDWGFGDTTMCSCTIATRVTVVMSVFNRAEAEALRDFLNDPSNVLEPSKARNFFLDCISPLNIGMESSGQRCFP